MSSVKSPQEGAQDRSYRLFLGTCALITLGGVAVGMRRQLRKENFKFSLREHGSAAVLAGKAFLYGTALCTGGFAAAGTVVCLVYDIRSTEDFARMMRAKVGMLWTPTPEFKQDEAAIKDMSEDEELDYWSKWFEEEKSDETAGEGDDNGDREGGGVGGTIDVPLAIKQAGEQLNDDKDKDTERKSNEGS